MVPPLARICASISSIVTFGKETLEDTGGAVCGEGIMRNPAMQRALRQPLNIITVTSQFRLRRIHLSPVHFYRLPPARAGAGRLALVFPA